MISTAEVYLWGTRIGIIHNKENLPYISFEYDREFLTGGIELSPLKMPLSDRVYAFPELAGSAFHGAPGLVADSLPDKFGNRIIEQWLAQQGRSAEEFNAIDRLCYTGSRGMGALEYVPAAGPAISGEEPVNIRKMVEFASEVLSDRKKITINEDNVGYSQLVQLGTSAGGARAKALIAWNEEKHEIKSGQTDAGTGFDYWLMKFDGVKKNGDHNLEDSIEYTLIEYAYYLMACDAGITMNECRIYEDNGLHHFMTKRFDRVDNKKIHMQTLAALTHTDYNIPGLCSYEQAAHYMREIGLTQKEIEQFYRRMVFNVIMVNQDDHVKNVSFLMNRRGEWTLAPAYDVTFSYDPNNRWLKAHQMLINNKSDNIEYSDMIESAVQMGIRKQIAEQIVTDVINVAQKSGTYFEKAGVREETYEAVRRVCESVGDVQA